MTGINRFYYPKKFNSRNEAIAMGIKCVFISHQQADKTSAKKVADYLLNTGIDVYFDEYDKDLKIQQQNNNPSGVTNAICMGINNSSHMLVIVSPSTIESTWVPFEIGYGFDKTSLGVLCLKGIPKGGLPDYIRTAKVIRDIYDLNQLIENISNIDQKLLLEQASMKSYSNPMNPLQSVMDSIITKENE